MTLDLLKEHIFSPNRPPDGTITAWRKFPQSYIIKAELSQLSRRCCWCKRERFMCYFTSHTCYPIKNYEQLGYGSKQPHYHRGLFHSPHLNNSCQSYSNRMYGWCPVLEQTEQLKDHDSHWTTFLMVSIIQASVNDCASITANGHYILQMQTQLKDHFQRTDESSSIGSSCRIHFNIWPLVFSKT